MVAAHGHGAESCLGPWAARHGELGVVNISTQVQRRCPQSLTIIMPRGTRPSRRSAPSGPPALPLPPSAPTDSDHQSLQAPTLPQFHGFQPPLHPHVFPGQPIAGQYPGPNLAGLAMNAPQYQPYGAPYYPPQAVYPPSQFIPGPGQVQPWGHAGYFLGHPVPPSPAAPASHLAATHLGPGNNGLPPPVAPVQGTPGHANRTRKYPNKLVSEGGKYYCTHWEA